MAARYLVAVPHHNAPRAEYWQHMAEAAGLICIWRPPGALVFISDATDTLTLPGGQGIVIGNAFDRENRSDKAPDLTEYLASRDPESTARIMLRRIWGDYVAVLIDPGQTSVTILRDPSGAMPCYSLVTPDATILTSDAETLFEAGLLEPSIDWTGIARFLLAPTLPGTLTALVGVREILPGTLTHLAGEQERTQPLWSPWDFVRRPPHRAATSMADQLRHTVDCCTGTWASRFHHILLGVSGGLDSSIVAASLKAHDADLTCFTMATHDPSGDERHHARQLTEHLGIPLTEAFHELDQVDIRKAMSRHLPRPSGLSFIQSNLHTQMALAQLHAIDGFFTGSGGDNVFCFTQSATPILDRFRREGLSAGVFTTIRDICHLTGCTVWEAIAMAIERAGRVPAYAWPAETLLLSNETATAQIPPTHPWLTAPPGALPGKAAHIASLLRLQASPELFSRYLPGAQVNPLASQPIVELCLSIPSWDWCAGGQNRAVARQAFAGALPSAIINRRYKAGPGSFAHDIIETQRPAINDWLGNGRLSTSGLLNRDALQTCLMGPAPLDGTVRSRISSLCEVEAWIDSWLTRRRRRDASIR